MSCSHKTRSECDESCVRNYYKEPCNNFNELFCDSKLCEASITCGDKCNLRCTDDDPLYSFTIPDSLSYTNSVCNVDSRSSSIECHSGNHHIKTWLNGKGACHPQEKHVSNCHCTFCKRGLFECSISRVYCSCETVIVSTTSKATTTFQDYGNITSPLPSNRETTRTTQRQTTEDESSTQRSHIITQSTPHTERQQSQSTQSITTNERKQFGNTTGGVPDKSYLTTLSFINSSSFGQKTAAKSLRKSDTSSVTVIGGAVGGSLLLVLIVAFLAIVLLRKHRKKRKRGPVEDVDVNHRNGIHHGNVAYDLNVVSKNADQTYDYATTRGPGVMSSYKEAELYDTSNVYEASEFDISTGITFKQRHGNLNDVSKSDADNNQESEYNSLHDTGKIKKVSEDASQYDHVKRYQHPEYATDDSSQTYDHLHRSFERRDSIPNDKYDHCRTLHQAGENNKAPHEDDYDHLQ